MKIITKETMPRKKEAEAKRAIVELKATLKEFFSSTRGTRARVDIVTVNREGEEEILDYRNISAEDGVRKCGEIEEIISAYRSENNEGSIRMFLSTDPANEHSVILHALDVPDEKDDLSIARKLAHKASEIRSLDDIRDVIRFKYMFPKSIKDDPQVLEQEVIKALAVNFEIFGTDIVENRSRYGLVDGKSSAKSLGKHQAFHVTLYYRYQCSSNGHFDDPMEGRIAVEIQFQNYMGTSEEKRDHHDYTQKKNHQIKGRFGLEKTFPDFIIDLLDVFANNYEFISYEGTEADRFRGRPINERVALTLLSILTESDPQEPRILTNRKAIQEILGHEIHGRKLISVLKKLSEMKATRTQVSVSEEDWSKKVEVKEERDARAVQFHAQRAIESLSRLTGKRWSTLTEEYLGEE